MIAKELRALLPAWATFAAALLACAFFRTLHPFAVPAYFIGAAALGAMAFGHEYSYRTVPVMLTLPVSRNRVLLTKLVVLAASLLLLALAAAAVLPLRREALLFRGTVVWLPFAAALFITPYLTVVTRSPLGGAVFTLGLSGVLLVAGEWIGVSRYGYTKEVDGFRVAFVWYALVVLSAASAAALWRTIGRLQAVEGGDQVVDLSPPAVTTSHTLTRHNPTWLLIKKELRLQQLAFAVAALFAVLFIIVTRQRNATAATLVPVLYAGVLAMLIGATASAEERHLRTLDAQLLLPVPASRQWLVKIGVVLALMIVLAVLLPAGLAAALLTPHIGGSVLQSLLLGKVVLMLVAITVISLYVSTLCASGIWALMISVPAAFAVVVTVTAAGAEFDRIFHALRVWPDWRFVQRLIVVLAFAVFGVVLRLAFANHRSADRSTRRVAAHVAITAAASVIAFAVASIAAALTR